MDEQEAKAGFDPSPFRVGLESREKKRLQAVAGREKRARSFIPIIKDAFLDIDPDIQKVILFGSLSRGRPKRENFDIDIGVRSNRYFRLVAWALKQEWKIDVVDLDALEGTMLESIESEAEILYER